MEVMSEGGDAGGGTCRPTTVAHPTDSGTLVMSQLAQCFLLLGACIRGRAVESNLIYFDQSNYLPILSSLSFI